MKYKPLKELPENHEDLHKICQHLFGVDCELPARNWRGGEGFKRRNFVITCKQIENPGYHHELIFYLDGEISYRGYNSSVSMWKTIDFIRSLGYSA